MTGYEVVFMAPESARHQGRPVVDAVIELAAAHGIGRYTRRRDETGVGHGERLHAAHFFELTDAPEEVEFVLEADGAASLIDAVDSAGIPVFCLKRAIEYYSLGANGRC